MCLRSRIDPPAAEGGSGRFAQVAGFCFEYDPTGTPMLIDLDGTVLGPGTRVVAVELDNGTVWIAPEISKYRPLLLRLHSPSFFASEVVSF